MAGRPGAEDAELPQGTQCASIPCVLRASSAHPPRPLREIFGRPASQPKNAKARTSMLSRGGAFAGVVGSSKAECSEKRARPSRSLS